MVCCGLSGKSVQSLVGLLLVLGLTVMIGAPAAACGLALAPFGPRGRHKHLTARESCGRLIHRFVHSLD